MFFNWLFRLVVLSLGFIFVRIRGVGCVWVVLSFFVYDVFESRFINVFDLSNLFLLFKGSYLVGFLWGGYF